MTSAVEGGDSKMHVTGISHVTCEDGWAGAQVDATYVGDGGNAYANLFKLSEGKWVLADCQKENLTKIPPSVEYVCTIS